MLQSHDESLDSSYAEPCDSSSLLGSESSTLSASRGYGQVDVNHRIADLFSHDLTPNKRAIMEALLNHAIANPSLHQGKHQHLTSPRRFSSQLSSASSFQQTERHAS